MRLVYLPSLWTIILDIFAWFIIHMAVVASMVRLPKSSFDPDGFLYRPRLWEEGTWFYEKLARVRSWKKYVPDGAGLAKNRGFPKKRLEERNDLYMKDFFVETCRAELTHWLIILCAPFFFLWNKTPVGWIMIGYALAENVPLILVQRYNRQRFRRILARKGAL